MEIHRQGPTRWPPDAHIHASIELQQLIQSKTIELAEKDDSTNLRIELSQPEWDRLEIRTIAYRMSHRSAIHTSGYFFQPTIRKHHVNVLKTRLPNVETTPKTTEYTRTDISIPFLGIFGHLLWYWLHMCWWQCGNSPLVRMQGGPRLGSGVATYLLP